MAASKPILILPPVTKAVMFFKSADQVRLFQLKEAHAGHKSL